VQHVLFFGIPLPVMKHVCLIAAVIHLNIGKCLLIPDVVTVREDALKPIELRFNRVKSVYEKKVPSIQERKEVSRGC